MTVRADGLFAVFAVLFVLCAATVSGAEKTSWTVVPSGRMDVVVLEGDAVRFRLQNMVWGPGWLRGRVRMQTLPAVDDGVRVFEEQGLAFYPHWSNVPMEWTFDLGYEMRKTGPGTIRMRYTCAPEMDTKFGVPAPAGERSISLGPLFETPPYYQGGSCTITTADGKAHDRALPVPRSSYGSAVSVVLRSPEEKMTRLSFDPPVFVHSDVGELRFFSGNNRTVPAGETFTQEITLELPGPTDFEPDNRWINTSDWVSCEDVNDFSPGSVIGMNDWLDSPAGVHGWMNVDGDRLVFEDGTPVKLYGTGIAWARFLVPPEEADRWAEKFAKYGVNVVRLIPFAGHGHQGMMTAEDHLELVPEKMTQFDYLHAAMKERGVYVGWSPQYHTVLSPADRDRIIGYDEIKKATPNMDVTYTILNIAPDIQDLVIRQTVKLLDHRNPHTGLRYAEDPAIPWIELRNENDIFFNFDNFGRAEKDLPGYFKRFRERFCQYLEEKYGTQEALEQAWGDSYPEGKTLAARDIRPNYPFWEIRRTATPYVADTMHFMYLEQKSFYDRYVKAIRDAGYGGALDGSCWQASCWLGHLYNTLTDAQVGIIDRHNYNVTRLDDPGTGSMTAGFQQVKDRPFNFSEWGGGPVAVPVVATYGLGLQGWDASCQFASGKPGIINQRDRGVNSNCDDFIQIGQFPALSRMVYRGDIEKGDIVANRRISIPGLFEGDVGFEETFTLLGGANNKSFSSVVPNAALMAGRVVLDFIDEPVPDDPVIEDFERYIDRENDIVRASNGQLVWDHSGRGFFTINTPGTQGVVGFAGGRALDLDDITIAGATDTNLKLYVSSLEKGRAIKDTDRLLITAFGRDANTGMVMDEFKTARPLVAGGEPLLIEPIEAHITVKDRTVSAVRPLDHAGRIRQEADALKVRPTRTGAAFTINGNASKTMYYLVEME